MGKCQKCGKPVYFAERRQSLGYDWHPYCLKCEECGKVLNPGQHAEHKGVPYCHIPCYAALFGPKLFGHGSTTESHRSFGQRQNSFVREQNEMKNKVDEYNRYYENTAKNHISSREVNGKHVLEGVIKIYWGTEGSIRLKEFDDTRVISRHKKALSVGHNFEDIKFLDEGNNGSDEAVFSEDENSASLPYFNPRTHPLFADSFPSTESGSFISTNTGMTDSALNSLADTSLEQELFEDIGTENFLSYDPIHKWETLNSLIDSKPCPDRSLDDSSCLDNTDISLDDTLEDIESSNGTDFLTSDMNSGKVQRSISVKTKVTEMMPIIAPQKSSTLPSSLSNLKDDLDDLLCVERTYNDHDRVYHTVHGKLPIQKLEDTIANNDIVHEKDTQSKKGFEAAAKAIEEIVNNNIPPNCESHIQESKGGKKFLVEKLCDTEEITKPISFKLGVYEARAAPKIKHSPLKNEDKNSPSGSKEDTKGKGPRALRRRKKMDKNKLKRRCSINGHWYDRDTSVFTPPKHSPMCVYTSSKSSTNEVLTTLLDKYKIESELGDYALYVIKETGERRFITENEFPLLLRVNLGPHEEIAKIYLMDKKRTEEISHNVAQFIKFSYAELRSFLNMFYEEEEGEADRIRAKYLVMQRRLQHQIRIKQGQGQVFDDQTKYLHSQASSTEEVDNQLRNGNQEVTPPESFA